MSCPNCQMSAPDAAMIRRGRALMCQVCPEAIHAEGDFWGLRGGGAVICTVSGRLVRDHVQTCAPSCPLERHPDHSGIVRWLGVRWLGVPAPIRWAMFWWLKGPLAGCGCSVFWKSRWVRFRAIVRTNKGAEHGAGILSR